MPPQRGTCDQKANKSTNLTIIEKTVGSTSIEDDYGNYKGCCYSAKNRQEGQYSVTLKIGSSEPSCVIIHWII